MAHQAQETFVAETESGPQLVQRGQVFADSHALVKLDAGRGLLFKPLDIDGEEPQVAKRLRSRRAPAAAPPPAPAGDAPAETGAWTGDGGDGP
jgi:hypothetical protein